MRHQLLLLLFILPALAGNTQLQEPAKNFSTIAFASDTQAPMWIETLWLKPDHNRTATRMVFTDILSQRPSAVFLLGDVVNLGSSDKQWMPMDKYLHQLRDSNIGVHAILGNHEVMGESKIGERKFQQRFPDHVNTGYVEVVDSVAIVLLNSNFSKLTTVQNEEEVKWYKKTITQLDQDSSIRFIITACHHSPYTDSRIVKPSVAVQEKFVKPFLASKKSRLFLSGHCHGFEHYQVQGKDFLVIGGGGGLHQPLNPTSELQPDLAKDYKPMFHYLTVARTGGELKVTSFRLKNDFTGFEQGMVLEIAEDPVTPKAFAQHN
ncbi:MAG: metallophosphoesterase family protein [Flavisolibacter sp.]